MSFDSVPGPADPAGSDFPGQTGSPYGAPTGQPFGAPTGPYGPYGPGGPTGPYGGGPGGPYGPSGPRKSHTGLILGIVGGAVVLVVLVAVAGFALIRSSSGGGGSDLDALPAPKTLGRDPVPAEKSITTRPTDCGVTKATVKSLTPGADMDGVGGNCSWSNYSDSADRELDVEYETDQPSPDTTSKVAAAIQTFSQETSDQLSPTDSKFQPMTGLGDDAAYRVGADAAGDGIEAVVVFRTADLVTEVTYKSLEAKSSTTGKFRDGAFRAAADTAKALGVTANPAVAQATKSAPVTVPDDICGLLPGDLLKTLGGEPDPSTESDDTDEVIDQQALPPGASTVGCSLTSYTESGDRSMEVHVISTPDASAAPMVARAYLGAYYEARAERPTSAGRYFQALSGLGDQAFCSYLKGSRGHLIFGKDTAELVVRARTALITVTFGGEVSNSKLTRQQTVKGAYAVAQKVAAKVK